MSEKKINARITLKHDTEKHWNKATNFRPMAGELIIYDVDENNPAPRLKVGDGYTLLADLPFVSGELIINYNNQISVGLNGDSCTAGYLNTNGVLLTTITTYRTTDLIFVKKGSTIKYKLWGTTLPIIACYDENNTYLGSTEGYSVTGNETIMEDEYIAPADVYIRFVNHPDKNPTGYVYIIQEQRLSVVDYIKDVPTLNYIIEQVNNLNGTDFSLYDAEYRAGYLNVAGDFKSLASYRCTEPVFVKAGLKIKYKLEHATVAPIIALYSENVIASSKRLTQMNGIVGVNEGEYIVPCDGYICFVTLANYTDGYVIFENSIFDGIKDYVKGKVKNANNLDLNILCLGDSIFGNDGEIVSYLAQFTGSNVVNGAIGGTRASIRSGTDAFQYLDGKNLVQALTSGNWTNQDSAVTSLQGTYTWLPSRIANLKALDMSKVDLVTMDWGTNDYTGGQTKETILSAYNDIIDTLQSAYPELKILITTPIWRYFDDTENGDNKKYADATLKEIAEAIEAFAKEKRIHVLNAYQDMPLSYNTAVTYFDTDSGVHLNNNGNKVYAHLLNGKIRSLY